MMVQEVQEVQADRLPVVTWVQADRLPVATWVQADRLPVATWPVAQMTDIRMRKVKDLLLVGICLAAKVTEPLPAVI